MGDEARISYIKAKLEEDTAAVDMQLSLVVAALSSYKHDTVLRPFPPMFVNEDSDFKDFASLEKTIDKASGLMQLKKYLEHCESNGHRPNIDSKLTQLLHWTISAKNFRLKTCDANKFLVIKDLTGHVVSVPSPTHIFEVVYSDVAEERFRERQADRDIIYAYHGSRVDNFHSILHHGLQGHMNKNALFGEGTYLSSELSVSMPYSPTGSGWAKSAIGDKLSCFAVCEVIDDEQFVKSGEDDGPSTSNGENKKPLSRINSRSRIPGAEGGSVPEKYYVVRNNDLLRVKYLLVYAEKRHHAKRGSSWLHQHKFALMMFVYVLILVTIGAYNSRTFHYYVKRYITRRY